MRLTGEEIAAIRDAAEQAFGGGLIGLRLFGSRVDDSRRGGDIDLHVEVADATDARDREEAFHRLLWRALGDRRIDVAVHRQGAPLRGIDRVAHEKGVRLL